VVYGQGLGAWAGKEKSEKKGEEEERIMVGATSSED